MTSNDTPLLSALPQATEFGLSHVIQAIRREWIPFLVVLLGCSAFAALKAGGAHKVYRAEALVRVPTLLFTDPASNPAAKQTFLLENSATYRNLGYIPKNEVIGEPIDVSEARKAEPELISAKLGDIKESNSTLRLFLACNTRDCAETAPTAVLAAVNHSTALKPLLEREIETLHSIRSELQALVSRWEKPAARIRAQAATGDSTKFSFNPLQFDAEYVNVTLQLARMTAAEKAFNGVELAGPVQVFDGEGGRSKILMVFTGALMGLIAGVALALILDAHSKMRDKA